MKEELYQEDIVDLLRYLFTRACHDQIIPDGENCTICSDNDHQAFECRFNAFNIFRKGKL